MAEEISAHKMWKSPDRWLTLIDDTVGEEVDTVRLLAQDCTYYSVIQPVSENAWQKK